MHVYLQYVKIKELNGFHDIIKPLKYYFTLYKTKRPSWGRFAQGTFP